MTTGQENPLGVASELPVQDYPADGSPGKQKIRASEVVIIILLVLFVLCCCCACIATAGILNAVVRAWEAYLAVGYCLFQWCIDTPEK